MNQRTLRLLIGLFVVLGAWVLLVEKPFTDDLRGPSTRKGRVFPEFTPVEVTAIDITATGRSTRLEKDGSTWIVHDGGFRADQKAVADLLARVDTMTVGSVASVNPAKQATFGVDTSGVHVVLTGSAKGSANLWIGNSTPDFSGLFLRVDGRDEVYSVPAVTRFQFDRGAQTWRDKKIVPFGPEEISTIEMSWADTTVTLTRVGTDSLATSTWSVAGNLPGQASAPADADQARMIATGLGNLMADAFPTAADTIPTLWEPLTYRFDLAARSGDHAVLEVGPKLSRGQHVVRRAGDTDVVLVGPWRFTRFRKGWAELVGATTEP